MTAKERLLLWSKQITDGYVGVRCDNFTTSWRDGRLFNAIIHKYRPDLVDMSRVSTQTNRSNLEAAFGVAEQLGVARLLDPEDVDVQSPDEKSVITYVSTLYDAFPRVPEGGEGISPNDIDIKWVEYQNMIKYLSQWIKHNVAVMSDRSFPNNPAELKALYTQYLQFKEHEIPLKENEKTKIKDFYKMLEVWIEFGRIHLPPGHHPNDVEKEWGKLIVAMLEREKSLRPEVERLETLQQVASRVQRDCVHGEDKLALARHSLQSDVKRLQSGIQFLNEAEIASYLLECESILRQQVVDIQVLLDGKFPFTDQLVRRVSNLRDDLLSLRAQYASLYSKGRTLTTEQTKRMISGITQSLNSGFSQNISLMPAERGFDTSTFTSSLTSSLTPGLQSASEQTYMSSAGSMESGDLGQMTHVHIPKPLMKSSLVDPSLTEEEVNMKYIDDLLNWVEDMQLQLDRSEWGSDMPSVAAHIDNHKAVHRAIEEFQMSLKEAKLSESQMNLPLKLTYSEKLSSLEKQYDKLVRCSKERQSHLESLHDFVSQATRELIWLNEKEEEEVAFDWSDRNSNVSKKRDYHADLMKELDEKDEVIKSVQDFAERLLFKSHPARLSIEAYKAAMQTQWSWILQLCSCVEQHLKENAIYFEFFSDAKESMDFLRNLQDAIQRKYSCDRNSSLHRLEDLIQESMEEKEQLLQYRNTVAGLMGRAKNIVQLKPRNPDSTLRSSIPVKAICDYRQIEITIYKDDECVLANNAHRAKWKVINPAGNEAMVPSVCFTVPPPNKEAVDMALKTEELYQNVLSLWHRSHINMKSVVSWHCLMTDIRAVRHWNVATFKTMLPGEHQQVLSNLQSHFDEFLEDCEESEVFTVADCAQLERDVAGCKEYYQELLKSAEREEHEESLYNHYISEIRNLRMHLEAREEQLIRQIRTPVDRDDVYPSLQRITDQEKKMEELNKCKEDLDNLKEKCEVFLRQAVGFPSAPTLSSELSIVVQSMSDVHSMSSIYMDKLKTVSLVVKHSQSAEALVKAYESKLYEEDAINSDLHSIETVISILKQWRTEIDEKQEVFHNMEDELHKARLISDRMFKAHNERDFDLDWHKEKADQLNERWRNIHSQIDNRLRDLDGNSKCLKLYKDSYSSLDEWVQEVEEEQIKAQENKPEDSKALAELLNKQKVLVAEIEQKQNQIDECQKYSEQCSSAIKDYELQLMTFRAMVDSQHKSPLKKRKMQSSSDAIQQEFMDLRTRYTALVTLMTQYVKFASETLKRAEDEERSVDEEKREHGDKVSKLLAWMSNVKQKSSNEGNTLKDSNANTDASNNSQVSVEEMVTKKEQISEAMRATEMMLNKHSEKMSEEEREKVQEQLKDLSQAYSDISQHCSDQPTHGDEDVKSTIRIDSVWTQAMDGLNNDIIGLLLPTPDLSQSWPHLSWDDIHEQDAPHKSIGNHIQELNRENKCIKDSDVTSVSIGDIVAAARDASTLDDIVVKMIEVKQVSDGLNVSYSGDTVSLKTAFQEGLIPASVYINILQRHKTCQEMMHDHSTANESHLEAMHINRLIWECISGNKLHTPERAVHTITFVHDGNRILTLNPTEVNVAGPTEKQDSSVTEGVNSSSGNLHHGDGLMVDAEVQCDLMSCSSMLIVLGNSHQFIGLVLPRPNESQFTASSSEYYEHRITDVRGSRLLSCGEKLTAFYIPEDSKLVDINCAIQNGYIDVYTADILKSIEIPVEFLDLDQLNEKFSSWLMYRKLRVDGLSHAGDVFTPTETKELFISFLMINSYIDRKSQQRVLILDKQLMKIIHFFLEDSVFDDTAQHNVVPLTVNAEDISEQMDFKVPFISEKAEEMVVNTKNYKMSPHHSVPQFDGVLENNMYANDDLKIDYVDGITEAVVFSQGTTDYKTLDASLYIADSDDSQFEENSIFDEEKGILNDTPVSELLGTTEETVLDLFANQDIKEENTMLPSPSLFDIDTGISEGKCNQPNPDDNLESINVNKAKETHNSSKRKSSPLIEDDNQVLVLDDEAGGNVTEISDLHHSLSLLCGHEPLAMSPIFWEEISPEWVLQLEESASLSDVTNSLNGVNNLLADKQDEDCETAASSGPLIPCSRIAQESHSESSTGANLCDKVNSMLSENEFYKAGNVTKCELGKSALWVAAVVGAEIGSSSPGDAGNGLAVQGDPVKKDGDRLRQVFLPSESGYALEPEPGNSDLLSERVSQQFNASSVRSVVCDTCTPKNHYNDARCNIEVECCLPASASDHLEQTRTGLRCSAVHPEESQLIKTTDSQENYQSSCEEWVGETSQQNINMVQSFSSPPPSPDSTQKNVIGVKHKGHILSDQNVLDVDRNPQVVTNILSLSNALISNSEKPFVNHHEDVMNKTCNGNDCESATNTSQSDTPATNTEEDLGIQIKSYIQSSDEDNVDATIGNVGVESDKLTRRDEESFDARTGNVQEESYIPSRYEENVCAPYGNVEMESNNLTRSDEVRCDVPPLKDEEYSFSQNKEYPSVPAGDDEEWSWHPPKKQDTDAPTVEYEENIDAQTKKYKDVSMGLPGKDENETVDSLIKHDDGFDTVTGNTVNECNTFTKIVGKGFVAPVTKLGEGSHDSTGKVEEEIEIPTTKDKKYSDAPPVKDEERSDGLDKKVKQEFNTLVGENGHILNKTGQHQDGKAHKMQPCFLTVKHEVSENDHVPTRKEVGESKSTTERNEESSNSKTEKDDEKFTILAIRFEEDLSTQQQKDEQGSDVSLMKDKNGSNDPTRRFPRHDPCGKNEGNCFHTIRKHAEVSDSPTTRDEDWSQVSLIKNECGSCTPPVKDEEWSFAPLLKEEEGSDALLIKDQEGCNDTIGKTNSDHRTRSDKEYCDGSSPDETDEIEEFDALPVNYRNESASIIKDEEGSNCTTVKVKESDSLTKKGIADLHTQTGKAEEDCNAPTGNSQSSPSTRRVRDNSDAPSAKDEKWSDASIMKNEVSDTMTENIDTPISRDKKDSDAPYGKHEENSVAPTRKYENVSDALLSKDKQRSDDSGVNVEWEKESDPLTRRDKKDSGAHSGNQKDNSVAPTQTDQEKSDAQLVSCKEQPKSPPVKDRCEATTRKDEEGSHTSSGNISKESCTLNKRERDSEVPSSKDEEDCIAQNRTHKEDSDEVVSDNPHRKDHENYLTQSGKDQVESDVLPVKWIEKDSEASLEAEYRDTTRRVQKCDTQTAKVCSHTVFRKSNNDYDAQSIKDDEESNASTGIQKQGSEVSFLKDDEASEMLPESIEKEYSTLTRKNELDSEKDEEGSATPLGKDQEDSITPTEEKNESAGKTLIKYEKESDASIIKDIIEYTNKTQDQECDIVTEGHEYWCHTPSRKHKSNVSLSKDEEESVTTAGSIKTRTPTTQNEQDSENADGSGTPPGNDRGNYSPPTREGEVASDVDVKNDFNTLTGNIEEVFHIPTKRDEVDSHTAPGKDEEGSEQLSNASPMKDEESSHDLTGKVVEESKTLSRRNDNASDAPLGKNKEDSDASPEKNDHVSDAPLGRNKDDSDAPHENDEHDSDAPPEKIEQGCDTSQINNEEELKTPTRREADSDILPSKDDAMSESTFVKHEVNSPTGKNGKQSDSEDVTCTQPENVEPNPEFPTGKGNEEANASTTQLQLLEVLRNVSSGQNLSMVQEVMERHTLGSDTPTLECIKEESSEDELLAGLSPKLSADIMEIKNPLFSTQDYLECVGRLQDHADVLDDVRKDLLIGEPTGSNMEELQIQINEIQSLESQVSFLAGVLTEDLEKAKLLLNAANENIPTQIRKDLSSTYVELQHNFTAVCHECAERTQSLFQAMEDRKAHLESTYQKHLADLDMLVGLIQNEQNMADADVNTCDVEALKSCMQKNKDAETHLHHVVQLKLEDVTFAIQGFISEHAHLLSPSQSSSLLKCLSSTQRAFRDHAEQLVATRCTLDVLLDTKEREVQKKCMLERHQEIADKLEEVCDALTLTENRLIGHQQQANNADCVTDLQQYQQEHQALQKEALTNATALNEVITGTKKFLEENRGKLTAEQIADIETKLEEAKSKAKLIQKQAEESRKDLEKVVTTAIKQESEKAAAVERLEESKNKIEGLLQWISNIGDKNERTIDETDLISKENGNLPEETLDKLRKGEKGDANGNTLHRSESGFDGQSDACVDVDKQYERVKARHQEILSQQQDLIMATQSAQALLDKQTNVLSPQEKEKLQENILELKGRYDASLSIAEQQMKQVQCVQEELKKFHDDCKEFEAWLTQAEGEVEQLGASAGSLKILNDKLLRQKSFSEDVISHKGDLRFITISGQKVLDVAKACGVTDPMSKTGLMQVDTSGTCSVVKDKLDSAASRYKTLHSQCHRLGENLTDVVGKYKNYDDSSTDLLKWLGSSEEEARKQQSEAIAAEPQILQIQLEDTKALQGQMSGHQTAIDALRKTADSLISSDGNLLNNLDEIQETVDDIVERYDNLSKSVSDRNEKLQMTLTRSMSVQDGLDEMMGWMEGVEANVKENGKIPLDSASIRDMLSKETAIEQDIASRQSSISAMKSKVKKFVETADASSAALLQSKMDALTHRFSDTCDKHKQKVSRLEQLKDKVEQFEKVAENVQQFIVKRSQDLHETDGPGKTFEELSELTQKTKAEMVEHASNLEKLQTLSKELCEMSKDGNRAQIQSKMDNLSNIFSTFKDTLKEKEEEVSVCQDLLGEFRSAAGALSKWLEETNEKVPVVQKSCSAKSLEKDLQIVSELLEEWTSKGPAVQDLNSRGSSLCSRLTILTSPAKAKIPNKTALTNGGGPASHSYLTNKELMTIQQNMSFVNEGYSCLGDTLKSRTAELNGSVQELKDAKKETENMMTWLEDMKKTAASWKNGATEKDAVKTQLEQQKVFEDDMKQKKEQLHKLREKLIGLIETHPNSQEADKWKQMLAEIDAAWADISGSVLERKQHLEQSNKNLDIVQSTQLQLGQWLSEKELMMSVLGPLSIDTNMLKMQKQQVQILQNEFKSRKPQFEQLKEAASAILNSSDNQDPSNGKLVRAQLTTVTEKWQGLIRQLDQRDGLIDQAVVKTGQFQELLRTIGQTAAQLEDELSRYQTSSTQPDAVRKRLEDVHNISVQLREERGKLKEAEAVHAELTAMVTEDYLRADLDRQLETVSKPLRQLEERAAKQIEQLNSTFASSQQFHQTSKDFQSWLAEKLQDQSKPQAISAKVVVLEKTLDEHRNLQVALSELEATYSKIAGEGEMLLQSTDGAEKLALQGQLSLLSSNWKEVKKSSEAQADKLKASLQRAQTFEEHVEKLNAWVKECEAKEGRVKLSVEPVAVENAVSQVKALQKDVDKHRGVVEQMNAAAASLVEVADTDTEEITKEAASISKRVDGIFEGLQNKRESLEKLSHTIKEFNEGSKEAKAHLEGAKKLLEAYQSQGVQACSNKNLTNMKAQQKSIEGMRNQVEHLSRLAQTLVVDLPDADGVTDLLLQADSIEKEYSSLNKELEETCQVLEGKLQGIGQFQNSIREMFSRFTDLDDELDSMPPVDLDLTVLKGQQENIESFLAQLQELMVNTANAGDGCKRMLETNSSPDLLGLKRDLDALSKQCGKLMDRAKGRERQVQSTLVKLEELCGKLRHVEDQLCRAVDKEASQGAVGMETDIIKQQLEAFKAFQKEDIDPLQAQLQDINSISHGLIQNAARGTNTKQLENDLEKVNTKWNTLNKKIAERSAQLHEALLHCGRFHDALDSLLSWLTDTEELMANQKPPSAEFKVVKAQIQEQKLLQRLLDDRKPTVELIKNEGGKVAELAESVDKEKVAKEMQSLGQRWDTLLKKAENRHKQLESILVVTQQFHETLEPLSDWLAVTEKRLSNSEPIGTETSKLEEQLSNHKAIEEEIMNHSKDLFHAVSLGQMLKAVSSVDDKDFVQSKLDAAQAAYIELQERCRRKAELLQQALANAQLFGEDEVALMNWLSEAHARLSEVSVEDYRVDTLEKQMAEQLALQSDIELRKKNVDQALFNGMELLKQTTGDEVVVIQGKLDGIKTKYAEIASMSENVLNTLECVLSLSTKLHHTHEDLSSWLVKAEAHISSYVYQEPNGEQLTQAQNIQQTLLTETKDKKAAVDKLNELSASLLDLIPWHTREGLDKLVTEDNERYKAVCDSITQQVDRINADILKSQQFEEAANSELAWLTDAESKLLSIGEIKLEQDQTAAQIQAHKVFSMDIMRHKDSVDAIVKTGKAIMSSKKPEEKELLKAKTQTLVEKCGVVSHLNSERCLQLERAHSLASQFWETYEELSPWLQETLKAFNQLPPPAIEYETLRQQQEELRQMRELIAEHKPHIDKMNKTGPQLLELSPKEGLPIREKYTTSEQLYTKLKTDVKQRAAELDEAISKSTQFHDKIDPMLESLERIAERLRQPPSISVEVDKIKEQITENKCVSVDLEKLQPSYETLKQRGEEMIARSEDRELSAKAVQDKLDHMVFLWTDIQVLLEEREAKLLDVMDLAERFWCDHCALIATIKDSQDLLRELEEPGVDPSVVKQQQEFVEGFKEEIDGLQEELDSVRNQGSELMTACGEPDKPVIKKSIDEVNSAWENLNKTWKDRVERLEEAMQGAVQFQDGLQGMFDWVDILEGKLDSMSPVGTDLETVKQQIAELKEFKVEAYQLQIEMERLNHQAGLLLKKVTEESDRCTIQEPMYELKMLWGNLDEKIISRQHKLEGGLLALGQFQHALDELLAWMNHTEELLNEQRKAGGDPKAIEIELAKHHVLQIDVLAHKSTVETVNKAGNELVQSSAGEEASCLRSKLEDLDQRWKAILEKTEQRKQQLESALLQAQGFHGEVEDMLQWLKDTERQLLASKAVGGLPDTAREQLNAHLELCSAFGVKEELYRELMAKGQQLLAMTPEGNTEQDLANLKDKWESAQAKVAERKVKLEEALTLATDFHNSLQDFINWLTQAEQMLNMVSPASLILETIQFQIDEHKMFVTEVNSHRDDIIELDKSGTHLKYFSQKQDVVLIKNLLLSVQGRWEKLVQRSVERGRVLDDARKRAKQFHENWSKLMEWLDESEKTLDSEVEIANEPDKLKKQLSQHKEFQKALGSKHSVYDTTSRTGRALKDKTSLQDDNQKLDDMLSELRDKWDTVCGKSIERQNKLEEALLFSGQFKDALQALIDWLYRVEPQMAEDQPVHGDIDLILNLIDNHKVFQKELGKRTVSVQALKRSARELIDSSHDDSSWVKVQMQELSTRWETVCNLSVSKQARLEQALCQAEEFHSTVHILLDWLAEAEQSLRFHGSLPDDEEALRALIDQHKEFMKKLEEKRVALNKAISLGEAILSICHPDSITTIKHWNTIIKARFEEVQAWARQHQQRLAAALSEFLATQELLENLLTWLQWAESNLSDKDKEVLPQEIQEVKSLIAEHQAFMEEMTRKQPDVDKITKTHKRKAALEPQIHSQIPVLDKGRAGRKRSPTQTMYASATQAPIETKNPRVNQLVSKWQHVWLLALDRRRKLNDALDRLEELKEFANFDFDVWRKRYMRWMNHKKSRVMDFFRRIDKDQDGKVTRQEFIEGILSSKFPTSRLEMSAVADIFDRDGDGYIDYYEFVAALHPNKDAYKPLTDADKIEDEVTRQVAKCKCPKRFQVEQIGANKYRFYLGNQFGLVHCLHDSVVGDETIANRENQNLTPHLHVAVLESCILFGDSQQLRLVRILRSTVMVRVGGGWMALDEFLVKNDPCRVHHHGSKMLRSESNSSITQSPIGWQISHFLTLLHEPTSAKGRTNMELREKFMVPEGTTQVMASFRYRGRRSRPSSRAASPNRSMSSQSCIIPSNPAVNSTPKTTPVQGSKLRLPGYLSGKGFQSSDEGTLINAAVLKARGQVLGESRRSSSRPGSKAGSRGSSRRGSDASDFDISDIQSVCSDASETVGDGARTTPRLVSRQHGGKPSKIPTPQRRSTPTSKLAKGSKR
ncbi:dystonin isoform X4 [Hippocampus comes]|uniref:dystonin isoform X4 n=1 Tax=Hippocampus comes TaxID=109280 RepID=UPI00094E1F5A|nr:PREDICTED: dystonin isoform X4 [Hippocampus comes]